MRHTIIPAVFLFLIKDKKILLIRRFQTGWEDGKYTVPSGHLEGNETIADAMIRETREEVGIEVKKEDLQLVHVSSRKATDGERVDFFFITKQWQGEPSNCEPEKCDDIQWFPVHELPDNTVSILQQALDHYNRGVFYSELF